jgi:farnesyl diphosphate synthase
MGKAENISTDNKSRFNSFLQERMIARWAGLSLFPMIEYALFPGGKRLRPLLTCAVATDLGLEVKEVLPGAAALECIHISSLIHDDLPCLDNDAVRRGMPSCHIAFGEASALLAGDALIGWAFELIADVPRPNLAIFTLAEAFSELCLGQHQELIDSTQSARIAELKTGALFATALRLGGTSWSGDLELLGGLLRGIGRDFGVLFQLQDDYDDGDLQSATQVSIAERFLNLQERFISLHEITGSSFFQTKCLIKNALIRLLEREDHKSNLV